MWYSLSVNATDDGEFCVIIKIVVIVIVIIIYPFHLTSSQLLELDISLQIQILSKRTHRPLKSDTKYLQITNIHFK